MNPKLKAYLDEREARLQRKFDDHMARLDAILRPATKFCPTGHLTAGCVPRPVTTSSVTTQFVLASAGLAEPPARAPSIVASPVVAPVTPSDTIAVAPASCSTKCTAQAITASTTKTLLPWVSVSSSSPATSTTNDSSTKPATDIDDGEHGTSLDNNCVNIVPFSVAAALSLTAGPRGDSTPSPKAPMRCLTYCTTADAMFSLQLIQVRVLESRVVTLVPSATIDDVSKVVHDAHSGIEISTIRSMPLAIEGPLMSDQVMQPPWLPQKICTISFLCMCIFIGSHIELKPWPGQQKYQCTGGVHSRLPPLEFCENSPRDELQEFFCSADSFDVQHCSSKDPRGTTLATAKSKMLLLLGNISSPVGLFISKDQCNARMKWCFNARFSGVQEWAPNIKCVQHASVTSYVPIWHEQHTTDILLQVLINGSDQTLFLSGSPHSIRVAKFLEDGSRLKCTRRAQGFTGELLVQAAISQIIGDCWLLGTFCQDSCIKLLSKGAIPYGPDHFRWEISLFLVVPSCAHTKIESGILIMSDSVSSTDKWRLRSAVCSQKIDIQWFAASDLANATAVGTPDAYAKGWETLTGAADLVFQLLFQDNHTSVHHLEDPVLRAHRYNLTLFQWKIAWHHDGKCFDYFQWLVAWALSMSVTSTDSRSVLAVVSPHGYYLGVQYHDGNSPSACYAMMILLLSRSHSHLNLCVWYAALYCATASLMEICTLIYGNQGMAWAIISGVFLKCKHCLCCPGADLLSASGTSSSGNIKMGGNEVLIIRFHGVTPFELLGSAYNLFSGGTCEAHKVVISRNFTSSNHLQEGTYFKVGHLNYPIVERNILDASHCGDEANGLAYAPRIWLVAWTVDGLEFTMGCRQVPFQGGRDILRADFSDQQVHVSHDYYINHTYYFNTRADYHDDSGKTKEIYMPWDPGKLVSHYSPKLRLGDKPSFKEGGMLGPSPCIQVDGLVQGDRCDGLGPAPRQIRIDTYKYQGDATKEASKWIRQTAAAPSFPSWL